MPLFSAISVSLLGCWMISSSLWIYPHSLSYFNESIGGPLDGPKHLLGSNVDWGQDLLYTAARMLDDIDGCRLYMCYFGGFSPADVWTDFETVPIRGVSDDGCLRVAISINSKFGDATPSRPVREVRDVLFGAMSSTVDSDGLSGTYAMHVTEYSDGLNHE